MTKIRDCLGAVLALLVVSCGGVATPDDAGVDASISSDAGFTDAGLPDAGQADAGAIDSGNQGDAGVDAGTDAGPQPNDAGLDAGLDDAGFVDAGQPAFDAGHCTPRPVDAGTASKDTQAPQVTSFTITPASVDTSAAEQLVTLTAVVADDSSGVQNVGFSTQNSTGGSTSYGVPRTGGTALNGTYSLVISLPRYTPAMHVSVVEISATDASNNRLSLSESALKTAGFPNGFDQTSPGDSTPPKAVSFSLTPSSVDTSLGPQIVTATAHVTDNLSGTMSAPGTGVALGWAYSTGVTGGFYVPVPRTSGTELDGTYSVQVTIPRYAAPGPLTFSLTMTDQANNSVTLLAASLADAGFPDSVNQTGAGDSVAPTLVSLAITPTVIDTSSADRTVQIVAVVSDELSGLPGGFQGALALADCQNRGLNFNVTAVTAKQSTYATTITMPKGSAPGRNFVRFQVADLRGNRLLVTPADLDARGLPTGFDVQ